MTFQKTLVATVIVLWTSTSWADAPVEAWSGLVPEASVKQLLNRVQTKVRGQAFSSAVITDAASLAKFLPAAGSRFPTGLTRVDFDKWVLLVTVFEENTNHISAGPASLNKCGTATVDLEWSLIEPLYVDKFPATCRLIPKQGLRAVNVQLKDGTSLGKLPLK